MAPWKMDSVQRVHWVMTWNVVDADARSPAAQIAAMDAQLQSLFADGTITYIQYQSEKVSHDHIQGRFQLATKQRGSYIIKHYLTALPGVHLEPAFKGMDSDYELKDDSKTDLCPRRILGEKNVPGASIKKRDFAELVMAEGINFEKACEDEPYIALLHSAGLREICSVATAKKARSLTHRTHVVWMYQPIGSGAGKTHSAVQFALSLGLSYYKMAPAVKGRSVFFSRYAQESVVIFDEFNDHFPIDLAKQVLDRDGCTVQTGVGSTTFFHPEYIIICTNTEPQRYWPRAQLDPWHFAGFSNAGVVISNNTLLKSVVNPMERRIDEFIEARGMYPQSHEFYMTSNVTTAATATPFWDFLKAVPPVPPPAPPVWYCPPFVEDEADCADGVAPPPPTFTPPAPTQTEWDEHKTRMEDILTDPTAPTAEVIDLMASSSDESDDFLEPDISGLIDDDCEPFQHGPIHPISPYDFLDDFYDDLSGPSDD